jgi:hypothetical protein
MVLNVLPIFGPRRRMIAMTTMATSARMIAYSTSPWPFSLGANNIIACLSKNGFTDGLTSVLRNMTISCGKGYIPINPLDHFVFERGSRVPHFAILLI